MNAVIFIRNLFTVLSLGTILKAQQIGKDIDLKIINEILFLISSLYAIYRIDYKKVIFTELAAIGLFVLLGLFTGGKIIIKEIEWTLTTFYFLVSIILLDDSKRLYQMDKERKELEDDE